MQFVPFLSFLSCIKQNFQTGFQKNLSAEELGAIFSQYGPVEEVLLLPMKKDTFPRCMLSFFTLSHT